MWENIMIDEIYKDKLPRNHGYVLRSSELEQLLTENNITVHTVLSYWFSRTTRTLLSVRYRLPTDYRPYYGIYMQTGSFLSGDAKAAKKAVSEVVLPELIKWLTYILNLPDNSTLFNIILGFSAIFENGEVVIVKDALDDYR